MRRRRGLSLLETILATTLLAGVALALLNLYPLLSLSTVQSEQQLAADQLALSILERTRAENFSSLQPETRPLPAVKVKGVTYRPELTIFQPSGTREDLLRGLRVTVRWSAPRGPRETLHEIWIHHLDN